MSHGDMDTPEELVIRVYPDHGHPSPGGHLAQTRRCAR